MKLLTQRASRVCYGCGKDKLCYQILTDRDFFVEVCHECTIAAEITGHLKSWHEVKPKAPA